MRIRQQERPLAAHSWATLHRLLGAGTQLHDAPKGAWFSRWSAQALRERESHVRGPVLVDQIVPACAHLTAESFWAVLAVASGKREWAKGQCRGTECNICHAGTGSISTRPQIWLLAEKLQHKLQFCSSCCMQINWKWCLCATF
ncbi:TPA: hypothetical protein ACH3X3_004296 [Trebouxia sp. C0006]